MCFQTIPVLTEAEVSKLLLSSHPTTCPLDPIPSHLLQAISPALLPALTHIINSSLLTGNFTTAFKQARITPLLKKPTLNTSLIENYRPVSLLPFIAKTLERVVFNQISWFLSQNDKLDAKQSGFRSGHSTETALLSVTEALRIAKADSKSSVLILLDLSAAFDTVNHQILLSTLSSLGITGISLHWFESYLTARSFRVACGGEVSKAHQLVTGVPQGSVLGPPPLLHIHYITGSHHTGTWLRLPLLCWWHTALSLFSTRWSNGSCTDLRLPGGHLGMDERTSPTAQPGKDWASCPLCHPNSTAWLHDSGSSTIAPSTSVIFDDQLTFKEHIAKTARSCRFALHNIRKIRPFQTEHAAQLLVQALVISRLDYCNALLAGLPSNTIKPLKMIQNEWLRLVFNEPKRAHVTPLFISFHWLPVAARIKFKTLMLAYRTATGSAPAYFHSLLRIYIPSRSLRSASERRLVVPEDQNHSPEHSRSPFLAGGMIFPPLSGMLDPCQSSSNNWKLISFDTTWLHPKKKKNTLSFSLFIPSLASLYLFEQCWCWWLGVTSTYSKRFILKRQSDNVFPNCKSLWIKASAKWLNVKCRFIRPDD